MWGPHLVVDALDYLNFSPSRPFSPHSPNVISAEYNIYVLLDYDLMTDYVNTVLKHKAAQQSPKPPTDCVRVVLPTSDLLESGMFYTYKRKRKKKYRVKRIEFFVPNNNLTKCALQNISLTYKMPPLHPQSPKVTSNFNSYSYKTQVTLSVPTMDRPPNNGLPNNPTGKAPPDSYVPLSQRLNGPPQSTPPATAHSVQQDKQVDRRTWNRIFNNRGLADPHYKLDLKQVEAITHSQAATKHTTWDPVTQFGTTIHHTEEDAATLRRADSEELRIVPYLHVPHPNGYSTICTAAMPNKFTLGDILHWLNTFRGTPTAHFFGGRVYEAKRTTGPGTYYYAFIFVDSREACEELISERNIILSSNPRTMIVIKRAPDRHDTENSLKIQGQPSWYFETEVKNALMTYILLLSEDFDYVYIPENHETNVHADYCYIKFASVEAYERARKFIGQRLLFHDTTVRLTESKERNHPPIGDHNSFQSAKNYSALPAAPSTTTGNNTSYGTSYPAANSNRYGNNNNNNFNLNNNNNFNPNNNNHNGSYSKPSPPIVFAYSDPANHNAPGTALSRIGNSGNPPLAVTNNSFTVSQHMNTAPALQALNNHPSPTQPTGSAFSFPDSTAPTGNSRNSPAHWPISLSSATPTASEPSLSQLLHLITEMRSEINNFVTLEFQKLREELTYVDDAQSDSTSTNPTNGNPSDQDVRMDQAPTPILNEFDDDTFLEDHHSAPSLSTPSQATALVSTTVAPTATTPLVPTTLAPAAAPSTENEVGQTKEPTVNNAKKQKV